MNLSKRLLCIANMVTTNSIIDVGCDHGYLDIYLTNKGIKCLATDISENCIKKAKENFKKYNVDIETKVTDGIKGIKLEDNQSIILAGMGAHTIVEIIKKYQLKNDLIISAHNNIDFLRKEITKLNYKIDSEKYVVENNKLYIIIKFVNGKIEYNDYDYILGPILKTDKDFLKLKIKEYENLVNILPNKEIDKINYYKDIINYCKGNL